MKPHFKVFGLPRSGNVLLESCLAEAGGAIVKEAFGWSNGSYQPCPELVDLNTKFVVCVRDPASWLHAAYLAAKRLHYKPVLTDPHYNPTWSFETWLTKKTYCFQNPIDRWNKQTAEHAELVKKLNAIVVMVDSIIENPIAVIDKISEHFKLGDSLKLHNTKKLKSTIDHFISDDGVFNYDEDTKLLVNNLVDKPLMYRLGFVTDMDTSEQVYPFAHRRAEFESAANAKVEYPKDQYSGRGIVIAAGGDKYFTNAYVCVSMLRKLGCELPIQLWYLGPDEMTKEMQELVLHLNVTLVDAFEVRKQHPARRLSGWELKPYSIAYSPFEEVMYLDADNVPVVDPTYLFDTPEYKATGSIFWPDYGRLESFREIWRLCNIPYRDEPEFESGQIVINKAKAWKALQLTIYMNNHSDFYYRHIHGDKETFHMAWLKLNQPYSMPSKEIHSLDGVMCQHDFKGNRVFQHRNMHKWSLLTEKRIDGFMHEEDCFTFLKQLGDNWSNTLKGQLTTPDEIVSFQEITQQQYFQYIRQGHDVRLMELLPNFTIGEGRDKLETRWSVVQKGSTILLNIYGAEGLICSLRKVAKNTFTGYWLKFEKMPITISPPLIEA